MKTINTMVSALIVSALATSSFAALPDLEANSLIKCEEASTVSQAVAQLNGTLASPFYNVRDMDVGNFFKISDYTSSQPVITKLDNNNFSVCVTLTRKK